MTENFHVTRNHNIDPTTFGGRIYLSDFETDYRGAHNNDRGSSIAKRIVSDWKFDSQCRKNIEDRNRSQKYKSQRRLEEITNA